MSEPSLSIVFPVYNQADHLRVAVEQYEEALSRLPHPYEIILVPNGCSDNSEEVCNALAADYETVKVTPSELAGWGRAVKHGLQAAEGDILCYSNLARTTAEELTLILLYAVAFPDTVVKANRKIRESLVRRLGSLIYNLQCRMLFDLAYWDINGTPKVFPRSFERLLSLTRDDDLIDLEFNAICRQEEYRMLEVPIFSTSRRSGKSTTSYGTAVRLYWGAYKMRSEMKGEGNRG